VVGDLVIWKRIPKSSLLSYGHVAVVVAADLSAGWVRVAEQNFENAAWAQEGWSRSLPLHRAGAGFVLSDPAVPAGTIQGWLHLRGTRARR